MGPKLKLDKTHPTLTALKALVPKCVVAGGSFQFWLPKPEEIRPEQRLSVFENAKSTAVDQCLTSLALQAGLSATTVIPRTESGGRQWPGGYLGSLSHKGTVVLAVMAGVADCKTIGIDVEIVDNCQLSQIGRLIAAGGSPVGLEKEVGTTLSFSAKEAVYKAQFPTTKRHLGFEDVHLEWSRESWNVFSASVKGPSLNGINVRAKWVDPWIVCVATG